jgi:hypothetical protein
MNGIRIRIVILTLILVALPSGTACSQNAPKDNQTPGCSFSEIYRKEGWVVPGLDGAKAKSQRSKLGSMPGVFVTKLDPVQPESNLTEVWCPPDHPGRVEVDLEPVKIVDLWSYDFGGRVFAYRVLYARERVQNDGTREDTGTVIALYFYDVEGTGRFTSIFGAKPGVGYFAPDFMPEWVKNAAPTGSAK